MDSTKRLQLIRLTADGELTDEQVAEFERHLATTPEDRLAVEFERELRDAVARVMSADVHVPADLRDRIDRAWRDYEGRHRLRREAATVGRIGPETVRATELRHQPKRRRLRFAPSGLAAGILFLIAVSIVASIFSEDPLKRSSRLTSAERAAFQNLIGQTVRDFGTESSNVIWLTRADIDAGESILAKRFSPEVSRIVSLSSAFEYRTGEGGIEGGFDYQGVREDGFVPGSLVVEYRENAGPGRTLLQWIVPADQLDSKLVNRLVPGTPYQFVAGADLAGLSSCYAWVDGDVVRFVRLSKSDAAVAVGAPDSREVAHELGLPLGELVTYP